MSIKEKYSKFCEMNYVPIYSKPWWLDAICGEDNWAVWLYEHDGMIMAAMPYYIEMRDGYKYITKPPLTQNNGIIFNYGERYKLSSRAEFEEEVINNACKHIESLKLDVYEQQFQSSFTNWLPFCWEGYSALVRYTYIFSTDELQNLDNVWLQMDKKKRNKIKNGKRNCRLCENLNPKDFYFEVEKVFEKQQLSCPFTFELWERLYNEVAKRNAGKIIYAEKDGMVTSAIFLVWDEKSMYQLVSGGDVKLQHYEGKSALVWKAICEAAERGLSYDFEGSVIKRISRSNRLFGARPIPYFRIRKVFNSDIIRMEAEHAIKALQ